MFETATNMIEKHLPAGNHPIWLAPVIALVVAWIIFLLIREFWCWFWKTSTIADELDKINTNVRALGTRFERELSNAKSALERIAENTAAAKDKSAG